MSCMQHVEAKILLSLSNASGEDGLYENRMFGVDVRRFEVG